MGLAVPRPCHIGVWIELLHQVLWFWKQLLLHNASRNVKFLQNRHACSDLFADLLIYVWAFFALTSQIGYFCFLFALVSFAKWMFVLQLVDTKPHPFLLSLNPYLLPSSSLLFTHSFIDSSKVDTQMVSSAYTTASKFAPHILCGMRLWGPRGVCRHIK